MATTIAQVENLSWELLPDARSHAEAGDLTMEVVRGRLNQGYEWSVLRQGNVIITGQYADTREEAKRRAADFARNYTVNDFRN